MCDDAHEIDAVRLFVFSLLVLLGISILFQPAARPTQCSEVQFGMLLQFFPQPAFLQYQKTAYPERGMNHYLYRRSLKGPLQFLLIEQIALSEWHIRPFLRDSSIHAVGKWPMEVK